MAQIPRELTPHASLQHFFGAELRQWRQRAGLSHDRLGVEINYSGDTIGKVAPTTLTAADDAPRGGRGELSAFKPPLTGHAPTVGEAARSSVRGEDPVKRFEFLVSVFGVGAGSLVGSREWAEPSRLGHEDVASWRRCVSRLYELDAQYGGGGVYDLALRSLRQLRRVQHRASYGPSTGEELHTVAGELTRYSGWRTLLGAASACRTLQP